MLVNYLILINLFTYLLSLKIFFSIFKMSYSFPFRHADLYSFLFNIILFSILSLIYHPNFFIIFLFININLFYIFFHLINMIVTSPRTKLIIDLRSKKNAEVSINQYFKKYNCKVIVNNRIKRLKTSGQIIEKNKYYSLKKDKKNSLFIIALVFSIIEKI
jgi:hypothetical protein|tara:strand:+ start:112 stop:591 length:480 start_codon:yes stop_codon:yes gene_type:complete